MSAGPSADTLARLAAIVGPRNAIADPAEQAPYLTEWRDRFTGRTPLVLKPKTAEDVAEILRVAHETRTAVVPQGGNTGLVGGQIPSMAGTEIVVSLTRLDRIRGLDVAGAALTAEAGVTVAQAQAAAADEGLLFATSLASEGTAQIGGILSTNAGGINVLRYGTAREQVLGLEVALPDGRLWRGLKSLRKDNTGYDLKSLFLGAEGTLGIITAASLRLFPAPKVRETAMVAVGDPTCAVAVLQCLRADLGEWLTSAELMARFGIELVLGHVPGTADPFDRPYPWYLLVEVTSADGRADLRPSLERVLESLFGRGLVKDAVLADSETQRGALWRLRETLSEAQKPAGGSIKHDITLPIGRIPEFLATAGAALEAACPGIRPCPFGHLGDGNLHYNLSQPTGMAKEAFLARWEDLARLVHDIVVAMDGSISAEHGIGQLKRADLAHYKPEVELDLMRAVKRAIDPLGIMNPGKVL